jgi:hypothetical protein
MLELLLTQGADLGGCCALFALLIKVASYLGTLLSEINATSNAEVVKLTLDELKRISDKGAIDGS